MSIQRNNLNMNSFQEEDTNNYNPNSSPKEEMVSLNLFNFLFLIIIFHPYRKIVLIILTTTITTK